MREKVGILILLAIAIVWMWIPHASEFKQYCERDPPFYLIGTSLDCAAQQAKQAPEPTTLLSRDH